jgi:hypothetical protein
LATPIQTILKGSQIQFRILISSHFLSISHTNRNIIPPMTVLPSRVCSIGNLSSSSFWIKTAELPWKRVLPTHPKKTIFLDISHERRNVTMHTCTCTFSHRAHRRNDQMPLMILFAPKLDEYEICEAQAPWTTVSAPSHSFRKRDGSSVRELSWVSNHSFPSRPACAASIEGSSVLSCVQRMQ